MQVLLIYHFLGLFAGFIIGFCFNNSKKIHGVIDVDHKNQTCSIRVTTDDLVNTKNKKAVFLINHEATLSREEHIL